MSQHPQGTRLADTVGPMLQTPVIRQVGALPLLYPILEDLGLRAEVNALRPSKATLDLGRMALLLSLNRLMAPRPMYKVGDWAETTTIPSFLALPVAQLYDRRLERSMTALHPIIGEVWGRLVVRAVSQESIDLSTLHWDTTTFYFEGEYSDSDLARYGHGSDHRSDAKRVKLGLSVTHRQQLPVLYRILAGNTDDRTTAVPHLRALVAFLARPELATLGVRPLIVSDCKMVTPEAVLACHKYQLDYLGPLASDNTVKAVMGSVPDEELAAHELSYRPQRQPAKDQPFTPYRGVWRPFTFSSGGQSVVDRALIVWSAGKERLDQQKRKTYLKRLLDGLDSIRRQLNTGPYQKRDYAVEQVARVRRGNPAKPLVDVALTGEDGALHLAFRLNRERLAAAQRLDGKYALATSASQLSAHEALAYFKGQDRVEKSIAVVKGPLRVRPMFLHSDECIEVLVFFNLIALLVRAILAVRLKRTGLTDSVDQVLLEFAALSAVDQPFSDGSHVSQLGTVSAFQQAVLTGLHLSAVSRYIQADRSVGCGAA
ncbi:MAG: IS1634 family transposase [Chloroflexi bacterium]|nr:MAG: IS1634 family transposase [Chloroflexota bacterium]